MCRTKSGDLKCYFSSAQSRRAVETRSRLVLCQVSEHKKKTGNAKKIKKQKKKKKSCGTWSHSSKWPLLNLFFFFWCKFQPRADECGKKGEAASSKQPVADFNKTLPIEGAEAQFWHRDLRSTTARPPDRLATSSLFPGCHLAESAAPGSGCGRGRL